MNLHFQNILCLGKYEGHTESHEQLFFACELGTADEGECGDRWNQLLSYPWVSCDINSLHHLTSITPNKMTTTICRFASVLSLNSLWKRKSLLQKFTRDFSVLMEVCAWARAVFEDGWNILKMGNGGNSESSASVSSDGWNGVLPQGNFQTSRTLAEMCTKKWRLCGKIKKVM